MRFKTPPPDLLADWAAAVVESGDMSAAKAHAESVRQRVEQLKDPFTPLARGDPDARAKEHVLWEDTQAMVVVDLYAATPKALAIPKESITFPCDAGDALLTHLSQVSAATSDAFMEAAHWSVPARCWVNPPRGLMIRQLHVHILPRLSWDTLSEQRQAFYERVSSTLEPIMRQLVHPSN